MLSDADIDRLRDQFDYDILKPWILQNFQDMNVEYICKCVLPPVIGLLSRWMLVDLLPGKETEVKNKITEYFRQLLDASLELEKEYIQQVLKDCP